jgi:hypothetical protein
MQAHHAVGQNVLLHHIGQLVGGRLAGLGDAVQAARQRLHDPGHTRHHEGHDQRQLPVQIDQVAEQGNQREAVARDAHHGLHQLLGAGLHLVDDGVGQRRCRLPGKQAHVGGQQALEQLLAQTQHAVIGDACQRVLSRELGQAANDEQADQKHRHRPQRQRASRKTAVEQRLEQCRHGGLGGCPHQRGQDGQTPGPALAREIRRQALEALHQRQLGWIDGGCLSGSWGRDGLGGLARRWGRCGLHKRVILGLVLLESARISIDEIRDEVVTNYACLNIKRKPAAESAGDCLCAHADSGMLPI